jgi:nitrate reductase alpha subunit
LQYKVAAYGWLPASPEFDRNPLQLCKEAAANQMDVPSYVTSKLHSGELNLASEDLDDTKNCPKNLFIWRANLIGSSAKGVEYFMKHLLGAQNSVFGKELKEMDEPLPLYQKWHDEGGKGKLDLVVTIDYRMTTSSLHSDIVLPAATWYEKNDISSTDMHPSCIPSLKQ